MCNGGSSGTCLDTLTAPHLLHQLLVASTYPWPHDQHFAETSPPLRKVLLGITSFYSYCTFFIPILSYPVLLDTLASQLGCIAFSYQNHNRSAEDLVIVTITSMIRQLHANNVSTFRRSPLSEISGSLGDLGTLLPLMIALAVNNSISLSTTFVFSGLWNIFTGVVFGSKSFLILSLLFY